MSMNDPLGDMLTRIRNAQMRGKSTVKTPASTLRGRVLEVLLSEGYIRGFEKAPTDNGQGEYTISLKYYEGEPVIREVKRVSKRPRRAVKGVKEYRRPHRAWVSTLHAKGVSRCKCTRRQCWRRSALQYSKGGVLSRTASNRPPGQSTLLCIGSPSEVKGRKAPQLHPTDDVTLAGDGAVTVTPRGPPSAPPAVGHDRRWSRTWWPESPPASAGKGIQGVGYRPMQG